MATQIEAARLLVYRAAYLKDKGVRNSRESAMAKVYASEVANRVATQAIQIFGATGTRRNILLSDTFVTRKLLRFTRGHLRFKDRHRGECPQRRRFRRPRTVIAELASWNLN